MVISELADRAEVLFIEALNFFEVLAVSVLHPEIPEENAQAKRCSDIP